MKTITKIKVLDVRELYFVDAANIHNPETSEAWRVSVIGNDLSTGTRKIWEVNRGHDAAYEDAKLLVPGDTAEIVELNIYGETMITDINFITAI